MSGSDSAEEAGEKEEVARSHLVIRVIPETHRVHVSGAAGCSKLLKAANYVCGGGGVSAAMNMQNCSRGLEF